MKSLVRAAATACLLLLASGIVDARADTPMLQGVLGLTASASVEVTKDLLAVTFSATREGSDAAAVQAQLKQALDAALAEARKSARPGQLDVQAGNFSLYPRYSNPASGRAAVTGWQGNAEMIVEGRDVAGIGQLTARITSMNIVNVAYRLSREASQRVEAELAAEGIAAYRAKAARYAKQFGYGDYAVREVTVSSSDPQPAPMPMGMRARAVSSSGADALPTEPGKALVTVTVNGTIQMK